MLPEGRRYRSLDICGRFTATSDAVALFLLTVSMKEGGRKGLDVCLPEEPKPFALAGLWDVWRKPNSKRVESFAHRHYDGTE